MKINVKDRAGNPMVVEGEAGDRLMSPLADLNLVEATCGGECSCATCHVYVDPEWVGRLPQQDESEAELLDALLSHRPNSRLACQIRLEAEHEGLGITIAKAE